MIILGLTTFSKCPNIDLEYSTAGATSKKSATNHSTFREKSELFTSGGGHVVPVVNNTTCFSKYKMASSFPPSLPLLSHSFFKYRSNKWQ